MADGPKTEEDRTLSPAEEMEMGQLNQKKYLLGDEQKETGLKKIDKKSREVKKNKKS